MITNRKDAGGSNYELAEAILLPVYDKHGGQIESNELIDLMILVQALLSGDESYIHCDEFESYMKELFELIKCIMTTCKDNGINTISIVVEDGYVDRYYRDSYYLSLSSKHFDTKRNCVRLFLFEGDINDIDYRRNYSSSNNNRLAKRCIGFISLSPFRGCNISRALLSPKYLMPEDKLKGAVIRIGEYPCTMYGRRLRVKAFPYMKQDAETISCAEVTALLITDYYSLMYQEYHMALPSEIIRISGNYISQRVTPSNGMRYDQLSHVLKDLRFSPYIFEYNQDTINDYHFILHSYLDSSIPVAIHLSGIDDYRSSDHSVLCIGFTDDDISIKECKITIQLANNVNGHDTYIIETSNLHSEYIVMDDNDIPYRILKLEIVNSIYDNGRYANSRFSRNAYPIMKWSESNKQAIIRDMIMPLNRRMNMLAPDAKAIFMQIISGSLGIVSCLDRPAWNGVVSTCLDNIIPGSTDSNPIIARIFMATSNSFKQKRTNDINSDCHEMRRLYAELKLPRFIWVCELFSRKSYEEGLAIGEIVLDATSSGLDAFSSMIMLHYPGIIITRLPNEQYNLMEWDACLRDSEPLEKWEPFPKLKFGHAY